MGAFIKLLVLCLALAALSQPMLVIGSSVSPSQCMMERQQCVDLCKSVLFGEAPTAACCGIIRTVHYECACPAIDPKLAALLTVNRVVYVFKACRRAVPHHYQCGSLYFP